MLSETGKYIFLLKYDRLKKMYVYFILLVGVYEAALRKRKSVKCFLSIISKLLLLFRVLMVETPVF